MFKFRKLLSVEKALLPVKTQTLSFRNIHYS